MAKNLYLIGGTMGVGKTTVSQILKNSLARSVFLDGDWCWDMHPFVVNEETKSMVVENICFLLNSFLRCTQYDHVIFCWVMHQQAIIDSILSRLDVTGCRVHAVSLVCSEDALRERIMKDVHGGRRTPDVIERSLVRLPLYDRLNTIKIDVSALSPLEAAGRVALLSGNIIGGNE